jgi:hypothetical protein
MPSGGILERSSSAVGRGPVSNERLKGGPGEPAREPGWEFGLLGLPGRLILILTRLRSDIAPPSVSEPAPRGREGMPSGDIGREPPGVGFCDE